MSSSSTRHFTVRPTTSIITSTIQQIRQSECAYFYYNNWALMLWVIASVTCFLALLSTIYTVYNAYKLWATIQDLENSVVDLIDDACQILLPLGVCKQICHPHHIGTVNANYVPKGHKEEQKPGRKENRYPEDVTFPPSDIEKVYDVMGDEDARKSKSLSVSTVHEKPVPIASEKNEKVQESQQSSQHPKVLTPVRKPSKEPLTLQKTPVASKETVFSDKKKPSLKTTPLTQKPSAEGQKTPTRQLSREPMTARSGSGSAKRKNGSKTKTSAPQNVVQNPVVPAMSPTKPKSPNNFALKASAEASATPNPEP